MPEMTEHDKLHKVADQSQACGAFLDWIQGRYVLCQHHAHRDECYNPGGKTVCGYSDGELESSRVAVRTLLAEFFDIDLNKLEREKEDMLKQLKTNMTLEVVT